MCVRPNDAAFRDCQEENNPDENGSSRHRATRHAAIVAENRRSGELLARPLRCNSVLLECKSRPALQLQRDERPGNPGRSVFPPKSRSLRNANLWRGNNHSSSWSGGGGSRETHRSYRMYQAYVAVFRTPVEEIELHLKQSHEPPILPLVE